MGGRLTRGGHVESSPVAARVSVAAIVGVLGLLAAVLLVAHDGRAASFDAVSATLTSSVPTETALEGPRAITLPAETVTETVPGETVERVLPAETVTVSQTETATVTETSAVAVVRPGAAVAGAAAASQEETDTSSTQWGWIAFGILALACVVFGVVWLIRRSKGHKASMNPPPAGT